MFRVLTLFQCLFLVAIALCTRTMPKRKSLVYYSQLAKRRFSGVDSMRSHVDSPWVSLDAFAHVDSPWVSVDATSRKEFESSGRNSSGTYSNPFRICLHQFSINSVMRYNESSDSASSSSKEFLQRKQTCIPAGERIGIPAGERNYSSQWRYYTDEGLPSTGESEAVIGWSFKGRNQSKGNV